MTYSDWMSILIPIIFDFLFTGVIIVFVTKSIERRYAKLEKQDQYSYNIMREVKQLLVKIKMQIIHIQSRMDDNMEEHFRQLFFAAGDLQIYFEDYEDYMTSYEKTLGSDFFQTERIREIISEITKAGITMTQSNDNPDLIVSFAESINLVLKTWNGMIQKYNMSLSAA